MEVSPYLSGIQSINGKTPSDKFTELRSIATEIIKNEMEKNEFIKTGESHRVQPALLPYLRILVGNELKQSDAVIEALKSDDITIIKKALNAKWFFNSSNDLISVDYFVKNILPYVSLRTRLELMKRLASCLANQPEKANEFFSCFADLYDPEQVLPLIVNCSKEYIWNTIVKRRINIPPRLLSVLYRRYPNLVIRYLQLGNESNKSNIRDRERHTISLVDYGAFLPQLIKSHTEVYVELYMVGFPWRFSKKLGNTRAAFFLNNASNVLVEHPKLFLGVLPLKLVTNKLTTEQFETMYGNLFPINKNSYQNNVMFHYLKYYPAEKKVNLMRENYRKHYGHELLDLKDSTSFELYKLLPADEKVEVRCEIIEPHQNIDQCINNLYWLPPKEAIPLLKKEMLSTTVIRRDCLYGIILSCAMYNSIDDLRDLLCYYNIRHKFEPPNVLEFLLSTLMNLFDLVSLPHSHWKLLRQIVQRVYIRGELFKSLKRSYKRFFKQALHFYLKHCQTTAAGKESRNFLEKLVSVVLEGYLEHNIKWEFISDCPELEHDSLHKFLAVLPQKYPVTHSVWKNFENKLSLVSYLVQVIHKFNGKRKNIVNYTKLEIKSYNWLVTLIIDVLKNRCKATNKKTRGKYLVLRKILQAHDAELYESLIDNDPNLIYECQTSDAVVILKRNSEKILSKWELYLEECKELANGRSRSFERFIKALKWHQVIPIKFVEQCIQQIERKDSILILGILLEGKTFTKDVVHAVQGCTKTYLSMDKTINLDDKTAKLACSMTMSLIRAINCTNPPVTLDDFFKFCQGDCTSFAIQILRNIGQRVPINSLLEFATELVNSKAVAVRTLGIELTFQVTSKVQSRMFLANIWSSEKEVTIRRMLVQMIFKIFQQSANEENLEVMKMCINGLTGNDLTVLEQLSEINIIDKNFVENYIMALLKKLDEMPEEMMNDRSKIEYASKLCSSIDKSIIYRLSEELLMDLVKRIALNLNTEFIIHDYLMYDESKFEMRLENLIVIMKEKIEYSNKPSERLARQYTTNQNLHRFFQRIVIELRGRKENLDVRIVDKLLEFMTTSLQPFHLPYCYILLRMTKDCIISKTIEERATRFIESVKHIIEEFGGESILTMVANVFSTFGPSKFSFKKRFTRDIILVIVMAMMEADKHIGSILGILTLDIHKINEQPIIYNQLINIWSRMDDVSVKVFLNQYYNNITDTNKAALPQTDKKIVIK